MEPEYRARLAVHQRKSPLIVKMTVELVKLNFGGLIGVRHRSDDILAWHVIEESTLGVFNMVFYAVRTYLLAEL